MNSVKLIPHHKIENITVESRLELIEQKIRLSFVVKGALAS